MTHQEIFKEFISSLHFRATHYTPLGEETIIVWTDTGKAIIAKRISEMKFEVTGIKQEIRTYSTYYKIGKNGENVIYNHDKEQLSDSEFIWKIEKSGVSFSCDGGITWEKFKE